MPNSGKVLAGLVACVLVAATPAAAQLIPPPDGESGLPDFETPVEPPIEEGDGRVRDEVELTTEETTRASTVRITNTVSRQVRRAIRLRRLDIDEDDRAAGPGDARSAAKLGDLGLDGTPAVWVTGNVNFLENDGADTAFDGEIYTPLAGADYVTEDGWVFGLALG